MGRNNEAEGFWPLAFWSSALPGKDVNLQLYLSTLRSLKSRGLSEYKKTPSNTLMVFSHLFHDIYAKTICTMAVAFSFPLMLLFHFCWFMYIQLDISLFLSHCGRKLQL